MFRALQNAACVLGALVVLAPGTALAGGDGARVDPEIQESPVVAHRMAIAISAGRTVLWDQIILSGRPAALAWILPVKPGSSAQIASDAWLERLDAASSMPVVSENVDPDEEMEGDDPGGCDTGWFHCIRQPPDPGPERAEPRGASSSALIHRGAAEASEIVALHGVDALGAWLADRGLLSDERLRPALDAYAAKGFDFIALRVDPAEGVQRTKTVRVISPGAAPLVPLRLIADSSKEVGITLFILSEDERSGRAPYLAAATLSARPGRAGRGGGIVVISANVAIAVAAIARRFRRKNC